MPTAARLVAVISLSLATAYIMFLAIQTYPELERDFVRMVVAGVIVSTIVGWRGLGRRVGEGYRSAFGYGLRAAVTIIFWTLFIFAGDFMIAGMMKHAYYQPMAAVLQIPLRMIQFGRYILTPEIVGTIVVSALFCSALTEAVKRKWD